MTTAGSELSPVTGTDRVIPVLLMLGGISLIGIVTATLAPWIVQRVAAGDAENQAATEIQQLAAAAPAHEPRVHEVSEPGGRSPASRRCQ